MTQLVKYERARQALIEAKTVDEVKGIRDRAVAMQVYAKQALDPELINLATEIKLRAERRAGEMLREMRETGERARNRNDVKPEFGKKTLADLGVTKAQSFQWQRLSEMAQADFEKRVAEAQQRAVKSVESSPEERSAEKKTRRAEREGRSPLRSKARRPRNMG